jgi:drug/metabolite transporter (DMT)-like permease
MERYAGELAAMATAVLWTLSVLAWTSAGKHIGAVAVSFIRLLIAGVFLAVYGQLVRGLALPTDADPFTWLILGLSGFFGFFLADICLFKAFLLIGPRLTLLVQSLVPPMAAILSYMWLGDDLTPRHWLAMLVTVVGVGWVVLEQPDTDAQPRPPRQLTWGIVLAVIAAAGQAMGLVLSKQGIGQYDAVAATLIRVLGSLVGYVVLVTLWRRWPAMLAAARNARAMAIVTFGALVGPFVGVVMSLIALRHCHAGVVATIISTMPVLILPFVILLYHEKVSLRALGGAILSILGVALLVF